MACRFGLALLLLSACLHSARAQELPELTPQRRRLVEALLKACLDDGGLKAVRPPDEAKSFYQVVNAGKLQQTLSKRREWLSGETREALAAYWPTTAKDDPVIPALLEVLGKGANDEFALGLSAFFQGSTARRENDPTETVRTLRKAVRH